MLRQHTIERAARRGELADDIDLDAVIDIISGYAWSRLLTGRIDDDPAAIAHAARQIARGVVRPGWALT